MARYKAASASRVWVVDQDRRERSESGPASDPGLALG